MPDDASKVIQLPIAEEEKSQEVLEVTDDNIEFFAFSNKRMARARNIMRDTGTPSEACEPDWNPKQVAHDLVSKFLNVKRTY